MQSKDITPGRDYAYVAYPRRNQDVYTQRATRVRVLKKGQPRNKRDRWGYDLNEQAARKDGVEIRFYENDVNGNQVLCDRTAIITARNLMTDWPDYAATTEARRLRKEAERRRAKREQEARIKLNSELQERVAKLIDVSEVTRPTGYGKDTKTWYISAEDLKALLDRIPEQADVPEHIDYADVAGVKAA